MQNGYTPRWLRRPDSRARRRGVGAGLEFAFVVTAGSAGTGDGVFDISRFSASVGCFAGDAPGFPVTIDHDEDGALDPGGFTITGPTSCSNSRTGFACAPVGSGPGRGIAVVPDTRTGIPASSGIVRGMGDGANVLGPESRVEDVLVVSNGSTGVTAGPRSRVRAWRALRDGGGGIVVDAVIIEDGTISGNRA